MLWPRPETESWGNNASGEFANLFSTGTGQVASTETPPLERVGILQEAISSVSPYRRRLGLRACEQALKTGPFYRLIGPEYQGMRRVPELWAPSTYGELFDAYRSIWILVSESLEYLEGIERTDAVRLLLESARGITRMESLAEMVIKTVRLLGDDPEVDRRDLIGLTVEVIHYEGKHLSPETLNKWIELQNDLSGQDFPSRLERYVALDLIEDQYDVEGQRTDQSRTEIQRLAVEAAETPELLRTALSWLVTRRAERGHQFGSELGKYDSEHDALQEIIQSQLGAGNGASLAFLGGYLHALFERAPDEWEEVMNELEQHSISATWIVELTWRSGTITERASHRILALIRRGVAAPESLRIFRYGGTICSLNTRAFDEWIRTLLGSDDDGAVYAALDLLAMYYRGESLPIEPVLSVLSHPAWFRSHEDRRRPFARRICVD